MRKTIRLVTHVVSFLVMVVQTPLFVVGDTCDYHDVCSCKRNGYMVTLRPFDLVNDIAFKIKMKKMNDVYVSYNPCTMFILNKACSHMLACQRSNDGKLSLPLANPLNTVFRVDSNSTVVFEYSAKYKDVLRKLQITLRCDKNVDVPRYTEVEELIFLSEAIYSFTLTTKCACPGLCSSEVDPIDKGLSFGSILVILFFVLLFVYFVGGFLFLKFVLKREGGETIPHQEFWVDLPQKVIDGCEFTFKKIHKKDSEYEEI